MAHQADLKQRQKTLNDMKANAVARTDNDLLDDVMADGTSVAAARDQKAKEGAEAKAKREADAKAEAKRLKEMKANASEGSYLQRSMKQNWWQQRQLRCQKRLPAFAHARTATTIIRSRGRQRDIVIRWQLVIR